MTCRAYNLGKPCTRHALSGSYYCRAHGGARPPSPQSAEESPPTIDPEQTPSPAAGEGAGGEGELAGLASDPLAIPSDRLVEKTSRTHRSCRATTKAGRPCSFPPPRGEDFCVNHIDGADTLEAARRATAAAQAARIRASSSANLLTTVLRFNDRTGVQTALDALSRLYVAGRLEDRKFHLLLRACAIASRNFDRATETLAGPQPQAHDEQRYWFGVRSLLDTIDPLLLEGSAPPEGEIE